MSDFGGNINIGSARSRMVSPLFVKQKLVALPSSHFGTNNGTKAAKSSSVSALGSERGNKLDSRQGLSELDGMPRSYLPL